MNRKGNFGVILLVVFLLLALVVFVVFQVYSKPEPVLVNSSYNFSYFNVFLSSNALSRVDYVVDVNGSVSRAFLLPGTDDRLSGVRENSTVLLSVFSSEYYFNSSSCFIVSNNSKCRVFVDRKALEFVPVLRRDSLLFVNVSGVVQSPLVCFAFSNSVLDVRLSRGVLVDKPSDLSRFYDLCYRLDSVYSDSIFSITMYSNPVVSSVQNVSVLVRDFERVGFGNIGDRVAYYTVG